MSKQSRDLGTCTNCGAPIMVIFFEDEAQPFCDECGEVAQ